MRTSNRFSLNCASYVGNSPFCVGFPQTLSGPTIFIYLFIFVREQSARHVVFGSIRKSEDPGNECFLAVTRTTSS